MIMTVANLFLPDFAGGFAQQKRLKKQDSGGVCSDFPSTPTFATQFAHAVRKRLRTGDFRPFFGPPAGPCLSLRNAKGLIEASQNSSARALLNRAFIPS